MGRRGPWGCVLLLAACLAVAPVNGASPPRGSRVSIYDGVLPSPDLGPRARLPTLLQAPVPAPAPAQAPVAAPAAAPVEQPTTTPEPLPAAAAADPFLPAAVPAPAPSPPSIIAIASASGLHCGAGCIAGATIGGVVLLVLLPLLLWLCCCCRRSTCACDGKDDVMSTSDLDLLGHPVKPSSEPRTAALCVGDDVFLAEGRNCSFGRITAVLKDDAFQVVTYTGESRIVEAPLLARNFAEGTKVLYSPPAPGRAKVTGTILQADGSYWPPFYQLTPDAGEVGLVNTTAQCLTELREDGMVEVCIDAKTA